MRTSTLITLLAAICTFSLVSKSFAQYNITVNDTDTSIHYEGNAADASICQLVGPDGALLPGQPGCYLVRPNCTFSAAMGQGGSGAASFKFQGTALYINSLLNDLSPVYTVTLDGNSTDVDGVRNSLPFTCDLLYSQTNLDPSVDHVVRLSVKGASPSRNQTIPGSETAFVFSLISFVYTAVNVTTTTSTSIPPPTNTSGVAHSTTSSNGAVGLSWISSWFVSLAMGCLAVV